MLTPDRRLLLAALSASLLPPAALWPRCGRRRQAVRLGPARDFSFAWLTDTLPKKTPASPIKRRPRRAAQIIKGIDFDAAQKIKFRADHASVARHGP